MIKTLLLPAFLATAAAALGGCSNELIFQTAPGAALPSPVAAICSKWDNAQRCARWSPATDQCVNPRGLDAKPPIVPCSEVAAIRVRMERLERILDREEREEVAGRAGR